MSKIILLNGCGSSGKTSIARAIAYLSSELWLTFGVDSFIDMIAPGKQESYFKFTHSENKYGPTMQVEKGANSARLFGVMPQFAQMLASAGNNLIIDEVLFDDKQLISYAQSLSHHTVYYIGVFCDLAIMQEHEISRKDRRIGLANDQATKVHRGIRKDYDFTVDTSHYSPFEAVRQILEFIQNNSAARVFQKLIVKDKL